MAQSRNVHYNTSPTSITSQLNEAGTEFLLITRNRQSSEPQVWSSGDQQQTQAMFKQVRSTVDNLEPTS